MRDFNRFLSTCLIISVVFGNFSMPALAYETGGSYSEKIKVKIQSDDSNDISNKIKALSDQNKDSYEKLLSTKREKSGSVRPQRVEGKKRDYVEGEILVKYKNNRVDLQTSAGRDTSLNFARSKSLEKKEDLKKSNVSVLRIKDSKTVEQKIAELKNDPNVEYAQPNFQYYPLSINTDDTFKTNLWGLDNTGQSVNGASGTADADIDAPEAWAISEGTNGQIIVAVIDTGVAFNHPDLFANMWDGTNCKDENGVALGGCNHGYDFAGNDKTPLPTTSSHGTHIAGTIAAVKNNGKGIIGVAPQAKVMAIKSSLTTAENVKSINFAKQNGAKIINASWGGGSTACAAAYDIFLYTVIQDFEGLFIASAGNDSKNHDGSTYFHRPSDYGHTTTCWSALSNVVGVAATDQSDHLASDFSDYGSGFVDIGAPGTNIYSTEGYRVFDEDFENITPPSIGTQFTQSGDNTWGVKSLFGGSIKAVVSDYANWGDYQDNILSFLDSSAINLSEKPDSYLNFEYECDAEDGYDFLALYFYNGTSWDIIDAFSGDSYGSQGYSLSNYMVNGFRFRFVWVTDGLNFIPYTGCYVDEIKIIDAASSNESYQYLDGTSMAAPHVAGLAALVWGYRPELTYAQVKDTILNTGDSVSALAGKTVTGKRINAYNALNSLSHTISGTIKYYDGVKAVPNATVILENSVGAQIATTTTDANGFYQFTGIVHGDDYVVRVTKIDNIVSDGIDIFDLIRVRRHIAEIESFDGIFKKIAADVTKDLSIDIFDLIKMRRFIAEIDALPSGAWTFYSSNANVTTTNYLTVGLTRTYTNVTADSTDQDFVGIKMGDVNNSWVNNVTVGSLTTSADASSPVAGIVVAGKTGVTATVLKLVGANETIRVKSVKMTLAGSAKSADVAKVYLYDGDTKLSEGFLSADTAPTITFNIEGNDWRVNDNDTKRLTVKMDVNNTNSGATSGNNMVLSLAATTDLVATGLASGTTVNATAAVTGNAHHIRKTKPTFTKNVGNTTVLTPGVQDVFLLDITADAAADVIFDVGTTGGTYAAGQGMLNFTVSESGTMTGGAASLIRKSSNVTLSSLTIADGDARLVFNFEDAALTVAAGTTETIIVRVDTTGLGTAGNSFGLTLSSDTSATISATVGTNPGDKVRWNDDAAGGASDYNGFGLTSLPLTHMVVKG